LKDLARESVSLMIERSDIQGDRAIRYRATDSMVELTQKDAELRGLRTEVGILRISQKYYRRESATRLCIIIALAVALLILLIFFLFF